ncbi:MAG: hypothetical protein JNK51_04860 [Blastocatellia bacterium]|nr:hypothetical protein [Chloracidobacterium sp.]MBL8184235.1 hypothetical protein [Blastocatellia bacterium]HBE83300.1 hypothetical protein [Blastocatellia bacterium]HRJ87689.1 hypothetical protein [Pyrinomonadaceae bacterium]HRK51121.1 hypothetical protein [Pyrinomonadaceae bacterium]
MFKTKGILAAVAALVLTAACGGTANIKTGGAASPTEAYKTLYAAVKSKDTEAIKASMTKKTQEFAQMVAQRNNNPIEKVYENGFTATTFAESLPEIRDERISGNMGAVEVWNARDSRWEDLAFINEDGGWKLAVGEQFAGSFKSPGKGRDQREREAANVMSNSMVPAMPAANTNVANITPIKPTRTEAPLPTNSK